MKIEFLLPPEYGEQSERKNPSLWLLTCIISDWQGLAPNLLAHPTSDPPGPPLAAGRRASTTPS